LEAFDLIQELLNYWESTATGAKRFHSDDALVFDRYQPSLPEGRIPEPWFGVPSKAKVFYLSLNPGHKPNGQGDQEPWRSFCRDMMLERVSYNRYLKEAPTEAVAWFQRNHGGFADVSFPHICNLRLIAYPSPEKYDLGVIGQNPQLLPSSRLMMKFIHDELVPQARANKILLLVMRSPTFWGFEKTETDYRDGGLFVSRPLRTNSISPNSRVGPQISAMLGL
jgi:hypothetical protein